MYGVGVGLLRGQPANRAKMNQMIIRSQKIRPLLIVVLSVKYYVGVVVELGVNTVQVPSN